MGRKKIYYELEGYWVYTHTTPDGMVYTGMSGYRTPNLRWVKSHYKYNTMFGREIALWGWDNIEHNVLCDGLTKEEALEMENEVINFCRRNGCSLNEYSSGGWRNDKDKVKEYNRKRWSVYSGGIKLKELGHIPLF